MKKVPIVCRPLFCFLMVLSSASVTLSDVVGVFYDSTVPQSDFAASEITMALHGKDHIAELKPLSELSPEYPNQKIVLSLAAHNAACQVLSVQGGATLSGLGEQAYALRTTTKGV